MQFTIGGHEYISEPLDSVTQWNVARRISPIVASLAPLFALQMRVEDLAAALASDLSWSVDLIKEVSKEVAKMSDEDTSYVLGHTLSKVKRIEKNPNTGQPAGYSPVWNMSARTLQYQDIKMPHMIQIVWKVLSENLGDFFSEFLSPSTG